MMRVQSCAQFGASSPKLEPLNGSSPKSLGCIGSQLRSILAAASNAELLVLR